MSGRSPFLRRLLLAGVVIAVVTAAVAGALAGGAFAGWQQRAEDALLPSSPTSGELVVVGIDDEALRTIGPLPWPRTVHAELADRLGAAGASVVVWDVVFDAPSEDSDADEAFAAALADLRATVLAVQVQTRAGSGDLRVITGSTRPSSMLADAAGNVAHAQLTSGRADGVVRGVPLMVQTEGGDVEPSLALAAYQLHAGTGEAVRHPDGIQLGDRFVPTEGPARLRLNFAAGLDGIDDDAIVSVLDVLEGRVDPGRFRDRIVLIGATDPTLGDHLRVPVDKGDGIPGVLVHANALNTILTGSFLTPVSDAETIVWAGLLALLVAVATMTVRVWIGAAVAITVGVGYLLLAVVRSGDGQVMSFVYPPLAILSTLAIAGVVRWGMTRDAPSTIGPCSSR